MARLRKKRRPVGDLSTIQREKMEVARLIRLTELDGNRRKNEQFKRRWDRLCADELRARVAERPAAPGENTI